MQAIRRTWFFVVVAVVGAAFLTGCGQADTTDLNEEVKMTAEKAGEKDLGTVPPDQAHGDAVMMGGGAKSGGR